MRWSIVWGLLCCWMAVGSLRAQPGRWVPAGADLTYPRTLLKNNSLEQVREGLGLLGSQALYAGLYADVQGPPPTDNTSANGRRAFRFLHTFVI